MYKTAPVGIPLQFLDEIMPEFPSNGDFKASGYTFPNNYISYPLMFQKRPWISMPAEYEVNQVTLEPKPNMFDYMSERIPTESELGLLLQARTKRIMVEGSMSYRRE